MPIFRFPSEQFRALPAPDRKGLKDTGLRIGFCYIAADRVPPGLWDWREVNPREVNDRTAVFRSISDTLRDEPQRFYERNRGISMTVESMTYDDKRKEVVIKVQDSKLHGVVDGAHTLRAILNAQDDESASSLSKANVFIKIMEGVDEDQIAEIAGGLNTSQQVDLTSLENLREHFAKLQKVLKDERYADDVAYKMNERKPVDVREILYYMAVFDCDLFNDKTHPSRLFGRKEGIVRQFAAQHSDNDEKRGKAGDSFHILITKAPDILRLRDLIEEKALAEKVGQYKTDSKSKVRSKTNENRMLTFSGNKVNGKLSLGWIMPMLAAFRANVIWNKPKGSFSWRVPPEELVDACIRELVDSIKEIHERENSRPEYVGRNATAWRMCYQAVSSAILRHEIKQMRSKSAK